MKKMLRFILQLFKSFIRDKREDKSLVRLRNFWHTAQDPQKKFLVKLLEPLVPDNSIIFLHSVYNEYSLHIEKFSSYRFRKKHKNIKAHSIWYASENVRPPFGKDYDCFLSWDTDDGILKNIFLPGWAAQLGDDINDVKKLQNGMAMYRKPVISKTRFACIFANNPENMRMHFLSLLKEIGQVDCYGWAFNNPILDKQAILKEYRFNLCFENDLYPNYVSEKIFDSYLAESIPIWWGIDDCGFINEKAVINVTKLGFKDAIDLIKRTELDHDSQFRIKSEPILNRVYDYDLLQSKLQAMVFGINNK
jgi:hypothetical protein